MDKFWKTETPEKAAIQQLNSQSAPSHHSPQASKGEQTISKQEAFPESPSGGGSSPSHEVVVMLGSKVPQNKFCGLKPVSVPTVSLSQRPLHRLATILHICSLKPSAAACTMRSCSQLSGSQWFSLPACMRQGSPFGLVCFVVPGYKCPHTELRFAGVAFSLASKRDSRRKEIPPSTHLQISGMLSCEEMSTDQMLRKNTTTNTIPTQIT